MSEDDKTNSERAAPDAFGLQDESALSVTPVSAPAALAPVEEDSDAETVVDDDGRPLTAVSNVTVEGILITQPADEEFARGHAKAASGDKKARAKPGKLLPAPAPLAPAPSLVAPVPEGLKLRYSHEQTQLQSRSDFRIIEQPNPAAPGFPALHLTPLNETFMPKQILLSPVGAHVKFGRQTNAKTVPNNQNGYFDSKVLSRAHAEVWADAHGRVYIKDVKSSNGTFLNGHRLCPESMFSAAYELRTDDVIEFGIDILNDDGKNIVHHKVSARIFVITNQEEANASSREVNAWFRQAHDLAYPKKFPGVKAAHALNLENVLTRLQGELSKSKETGLQLHHVSATLADVRGTLSGATPYTGPPLAALGPKSAPNDAAPAATLLSFQQQLHDTQVSVSSQMEHLAELERSIEAQQKMSAVLHERIMAMGGPSGGAFPPLPGSPSASHVPDASVEQAGVNGEGDQARAGETGAGEAGTSEIQGSDKDDAPSAPAESAPAEKSVNGEAPVALNATSAAVAAATLASASAVGAAAATETSSPTSPETPNLAVLLTTIEKLEKRIQDLEQGQQQLVAQKEETKTVLKSELNTELHSNFDSWTTAFQLSFQQEKEDLLRRQQQRDQSEVIRWMDEYTAAKREAPTPQAPSKLAGVSRAVDSGRPSPRSSSPSSISTSSFMSDTDSVMTSPTSPTESLAGEEVVVKSTKKKNKKKKGKKGAAGAAAAARQAPAPVETALGDAVASLSSSTVEQNIVKRPHVQKGNQFMHPNITTQTTITTGTAILVGALLWTVATKAKE